MTPSLGLVPSPQQAAIYEEMAVGTSSIVIRAVAGAGKTTTMVEGVNRAPPELRVGAIAYNKAIATVLGRRMRAGAWCGTFHSLAFGALRAMYPKIRLDGRKLHKLVRAQIGDEEMAQAVIWLVGMAKNSALGLDPRRDLRAQMTALIDHHDRRQRGPDLPRWLSLSARLLQASAEDTTTADFDDMLYMPLHAGRNGWPQFDLLVVDEAQDTNPARAEIIDRCLAPGGRLVLVGDPFQAIYGFSGAGSASIDTLSRRFGCKPMALSTSFRCADAIVDEAQDFCPHIEAREGAPEGRVSTLSVYDETSFAARDVVLCRNTAPLVAMALAMMRRRIPFRLAGRDIGKGFTRLVERLAGKRWATVDQLLVRLREWKRREVARVEADRRPDLVQGIVDKAMTIAVFVAELDEDDRTIEALKASIADLFGGRQPRQAVELSTIHRAKGQEWERVFILDPELMPSRFATLPWMRREERNLQYVAVTRARREVVYISSDCWERGAAPRAPRPSGDGDVQPSLFGGAA